MILAVHHLTDRNEVLLLQVVLAEVNVAGSGACEEVAFLEEGRGFVVFGGVDERAVDEGLDVEFGEEGGGGGRGGGLLLAGGLLVAALALFDVAVVGHVVDLGVERLAPLDVDLLLLQFRHIHHRIQPPTDDRVGLHNHLYASDRPRVHFNVLQHAPVLPQVKQAPFAAGDDVLATVMVGDQEGRVLWDAGEMGFDEGVGADCPFGEVLDAAGDEPDAGLFDDRALGQLDRTQVSDLPRRGVHEVTQRHHPLPLPVNHLHYQLIHRINPIENSIPITHQLDTVND